MKTPPKIAIIGGGPAGLMAAEKLAAAGCTVTIYDHMPTVGRKFLMAGRGGLNLTHSETLDVFIKKYGDAADWLRPVIESFPPNALRDWCHGLGQETFVGSSGRIFPRSMKASPLLRAWLRRLDEAGVTFALRHTWRGWNEAGDLIFIDANEKTINVKADATLLALGGASWPKLGSDGGWTEILRTQNIDISPLRPSNCGFVAGWSDIFADKCAGQPIKPVTLSFANQSLQGEMMITKNGIEGGAVYALSSALRDAIDKTSEAILSVDLRPSLSLNELTSRLQNAPRGSQSTSTYLRKAAGMSPAAIGLIYESLRETPNKTPMPTTPHELAALIKQTKIRLTSTAPITQAISSAGGITRDALDNNLMLKKKRGVFACGEMLDWEASTGGYLLQACFSTAVTAANGIITFTAT